MPRQFLVSHGVRAAAAMRGRIHLPGGHEDAYELPVSAGNLFAHKPRAARLACGLLALPGGVLLRLCDRGAGGMRCGHVLSAGILFPRSQSLPAGHVGLRDRPGQQFAVLRVRRWNLLSLWSQRTGAM